MSAPAPPPRAAFLGLGMLGAPLARRLLRSGVPLAVWNRTPSRSAPFAADGALVASTPAEAARAASSGLLFTCLTDGAAVRAALFGRGGAARGASAEALFVDLSTVGPSESREMARRLEGQGKHFVDAPVGGSVDAAAQGQVLFYAGGAERDVARARPYLERMGRAVHVMGPVGSGSSAKLVNNFLTLAHVALLGEALALGDGLGLEPTGLLEVLAQGGAHSRMLERKKGPLASRRYDPQFYLRHAVKDLRLVERAGKEGGVVLPLAREVRRLYDLGVEQGRSDQDFSAVAEVARGKRTSPSPSTPP